MFTTRIRMAGLGIGIAVSLAILPLMTFAVGTGQEGCTPGYWKNHPEDWQEVSPNQTVGSIFFANYAQSGDSLIDALGYGGGPGVDGARQILLRAAVASFLNAAHDDLGFPLQRHNGEPGGNGFVDDVRSLLANGSRSEILAFASYLDRLNNLGCPLS